MPDLSAYLIIDASTGTVLSASTCYLVPDEAFAADDWELLESLSDSEMGLLARQEGHKLTDVVSLPTPPN
jgi:hypothetical protein